MKTVRMWLCVLLLCSCGLLLGLQDAHAWWWKAKPKTKPAATRYPTPAAKAAHAQAASRAQSKYAYIRSHDYNGDGVVNAKDRLRWVEINRATASTVLVSKENEDIIEIMDLNKDGRVDALEMKIFYEKYDINKDGTLDSVEISSIIEE